MTIQPFRSAAAKAESRQVVPRLLDIRDRACLRLLYRADAATVDQLATLVYGHRRRAQRRLQRLWLTGLVERTALPPPGGRGGAPNAYRLSPRACRLLGYRQARRRQTHLAHTLDAVEAVCAVIRSAPAGTYPVQAWLTEPMARHVMSNGVEPDAIVVLQLDGGSGVLCIEIDEATEHLSEIQRKLELYRRYLSDRLGWHLLLTVPDPGRVSWLQRLGARSSVGQARTIWIAELPELGRRGAATTVHPIGGEPRRRLESILIDSGPRICPTPVATWSWLELLADGSGEDLRDVLR